MLQITSLISRLQLREGRACQIAPGSGFLFNRALRARLDTALRAEEELVLDPAFFDHFAAVTPGVAWAETAPKLGGYDNELSRFRFDAWVWKAGPEHHPGGLSAPRQARGPWRRPRCSLPARQSTDVRN